MNWETNYFKMSKEDQALAQSALFWEYVDSVEEEARDTRQFVSLTEVFCTDLYHHEKNENYETCQLYKDTFIRYKSQFIDFG